MFDFLRPEVRAMITRWREALIGGAVAALGLWWALTTYGVLQWFGMVLVVGGALMALAGVQRGRFRGAGEGPGIVQVTEGQIAYFGPQTGGAVSTDLALELAFLRDANGAAWELSHENGPPLRIPTEAQGTEALFDAFGALPGLSQQSLLQALADPSTGRRVLWSRGTDAQRLLT